MSVASHCECAKGGIQIRSPSLGSKPSTLPPVAADLLVMDRGIGWKTFENVKLPFLTLRLLNIAWAISLTL